MIARRLIVALVLAIVISGLFTAWLGKRFGHARSSATAARTLYFGTAREMEAGDILKATDLKSIPWPSNTPLTGAHTKQDDLVGRTVLYPLAAGEPIVDRQLSAAGGGQGLATRIPDGMRALSLKSDQIVGVAGFLLPGTHVDVLVTYHLAGNPDPVTSTVLQDARILAAGQKTQPDPEGKATTVDVVTLLVSPGDAEKTVLASTQGTVHFVLRNGGDHAQVNDPPTEMAALGPVPMTKPAATPAAATAVHKPAPKPAPGTAAPKPYTVTVQNGEKASSEVFN